MISIDTITPTVKIAHTWDSTGYTPQSISVHLTAAEAQTLARIRAAYVADLVSLPGGNDGNGTIRQLLQDIEAAEDA